MNKTKINGKSSSLVLVHKDGNLIDKLCLICGDRASAYNFGGLSCESCKIFFRRNAPHSKIQKCFKAGQCQITLANRKSCPKCRLEKCYSIGMKKQLIHSRKTNDENKDDLLALKSEIVRDERIFYKHQLNAHEMEQLSEIQNAMSIFTNENQQELVGVVDNCFDAFNLKGLYTKKIIKFCKAIPPFKRLNQRDQLVILKHFHPEITSIRAAYNYDLEKDGFNQIVNENGDKVVFIPSTAFENKTVSDLVVFCRNFLRFFHSILEDDCNLKNLVIAHALFKPRENLTDIEFISNQYLVYCRLIRRYMEHKFRKSATTDELENKYAAIMLMLKDLDYVRNSTQHILGEMDRQRVYSLMAEIYNIN